MSGMETNNAKAKRADEAGFITGVNGCMISHASKTTDIKDKSNIFKLAYSSPFAHPNQAIAVY